MKRLVTTSVIGLILAIALGFGLVPAAEQTAFCAECETSNSNGIGTIFAEFAKECEKRTAEGKRELAVCFGKDYYPLILPVMVALGRDNRFGPGDRILLIGQTQNGSLVAGANRTFNTIAPLNKPSLTVTVNKTDGKNGAIVKICTVDEKGVQKRVGTINFPEDSDITGSKSVTVTGTEGKVVVVEVASFGSAVRKFAYTVKTN